MFHIMDWTFINGLSFMSSADPVFLDSLSALDKNTTVTHKIHTRDAGLRSGCDCPRYVVKRTWTNTLATGEVILGEVRSELGWQEASQDYREISRCCSAQGFELTDSGLT